MAAKTPKTEQTEIEVMTIKQGRVEVYIKGTSPFVFNAMSFKAKTQLLAPSPRKTVAERAENQKHNPMEEYRNSVYARREDTAPTRLIFPGSAFRRAMQTAALDLPGMRKAQIGRLTWINEYDVEIFGVPQILLSVVRMADISKTPDIRTRAILPKWACKISVNYVVPLIKEHQIGKLLGAAGFLVGVGDGRQEKGGLSFGQFEIVGENDAEWHRIVKTGGRPQQDKALAEPVTFDLETDRLLTWNGAEMKRRGEGKRTKEVA